MDGALRAIVHEDVIGLDIPMDDWGTLPMKVGESREALADNFQALRVCQGKPATQSSTKNGLEV
jgi:hypothetical protein